MKKMMMKMMTMKTMTRMVIYDFNLFIPYIFIAFMKS
jgi:hypothetical protein